MTGWEIQCLPYVGFFHTNYRKFIILFCDFEAPSLWLRYREKEKVPSPFSAWWGYTHCVRCTSFSRTIQYLLCFKSLKYIIFFFSFSICNAMKIAYMVGYSYFLKGWPICRCHLLILSRSRYLNWILELSRISSRIGPQDTCTIVSGSPSEMSWGSLGGMYQRKILYLTIARCKVVSRAVWGIWQRIKGGRQTEALSSSWGGNPGDTGVIFSSFYYLTKGYMLGLSGGN